MIVTSRHTNALRCASGSWRIWSLSDGYVELPAELLKEPDGREAFANLARIVIARDAAAKSLAERHLRRRDPCARRAIRSPGVDLDLRGKDMRSDLCHNRGLTSAP
ncbi:MAG: hypothetical protein FJX20_02200 [Alphaproteobacteria bacterium]|nr:hypothetical protein [Alphaproteobacteria bacterium]